MSKFSYEVSIQSTLTKHEWIIVFEKARKRNILDIHPGQWLYGFYNRVCTFDALKEDPIFLKFRQADSLCKLFEDFNSPFYRGTESHNIFDKCMIMCNEINEEYLRTKSF